MRPGMRLIRSGRPISDSVQARAMPDHPQEIAMWRELTIDGLTLRLRTIRPYRRCRTLTYVEVRHKGHWLHCGDPHHGETTSPDISQ